MFTRLLNSIRDSIARSPNNHPTNNDSTDNKSREQGSYSSEIGRRPSITDELNNENTRTMFTENALGRNNSISFPEPIPINEVAIPGSKRRNSTIFGISNVNADDYVQKDLISSSWS